MSSPYLAVAWGGKVSLYRRDSSSALTFVSTTTVTTANITDIKWDPTGVYLAISFGFTAPYAAVYKLAGASGSETFTALSNPATAYNNRARYVAWSNSGTRLMVGGYDSANGVNSPITQFYNFASDTLTFDRSYTYMARAGWRATFTPDDKYILITQSAGTGGSELLSLNANGLDYDRTNFYLNGYNNSTGVAAAQKLLSIGGNYGTPLKAFDNTSGTPSEFSSYPSGRPAYGGPVAFTSAADYLVCALGYTTATLADQLKLYAVSGGALTVQTGPNTQPVPSLTSDGNQLANDLAFTRSGDFLAVGLGVASAPFFVWYSRSGGSLTKLTNPSTMPTSAVVATAWSEPPTPTITMAASTDNATAVLQQGPVLQDSQGYFLQGPVLQDATARFQQGTVFIVASTDNATGSFTEGNDGPLHSTLASAAASFSEGNDGPLHATLQAVTAVFKEGDDGKMTLTLGGASANIHISLAQEYDSFVYDSLVAGDGASGALRCSSSIVDTAAFVDAVKLAFAVNIQDVVNLTASATGHYTLTALVIEQMKIYGVASSTLEAINMLSDAIKLKDTADRAFVAVIHDAVNLGENIEGHLNAIAQALDTLAVEDVLSQSVVVVKAITDAVNLADNFSLSAVLNAMITDQVDFKISFGTDFGVFETWVINSETGAPSRYDTFDFNSYANRRGLSLGANDSGLYQLDNDDDEGQEINASFTTGKLRFNTSLLTNVHSVYIAFSATGKMALKVVSEQNGKPIERWYQLEGNPGEAREGRFKLGRGSKSPFWQFTLVNITGADFNIDEMDYDVIRLSRRV